MTRTVESSLPVPAFGKLVAAPHDKLESVAFSALIAARVHAACVRNNFQVTSASLSASTAVGVEEVGVLCGYAFHVPITARNGPPQEGRLIGED